MDNQAILLERIKPEYLFMRIGHKPRIMRIAGDWCCVGLTGNMVFGLNTVIGVGKSPRDAYKEWRTRA